MLIKNLNFLPYHDSLLPSLGFKEVRRGTWAAKAPYEDAVVFGSVDGDFVVAWNIDQDEFDSIVDMYPDVNRILRYANDNLMMCDKYNLREILGFCL